MPILKCAPITFSIRFIMFVLFSHSLITIKSNLSRVFLARSYCSNVTLFFVDPPEINSLFQQQYVLTYKLSAC
eukprot:UN21776